MLYNGRVIYCEDDGYEVWTTDGKLLVAGLPSPEAAKAWIDSE